MNIRIIKILLLCYGLLSVLYQEWRVRKLIFFLNFFPWGGGRGGVKGEALVGQLVVTVLSHLLLSHCSLHLFFFFSFLKVARKLDPYNTANV